MDDTKESFESFVKSFFYGSRSDLSFKFLAELGDDADTFIVELFRTLVDGVDDGRVDGIKEQIIQGQVQAFAHPEKFAYDSGPFLQPKSTPENLTFSLITSSGHFVTGDDPKPLGVENMTQEEAEKRVMEFVRELPQLSEIPFETPKSELCVRHGGYDIRAAAKDNEVCLPLAGMRALADQEKIGRLTPNAYSFMGACSQKRLTKKVLPGWVEEFKNRGVDAVVLVPV
ncbi:MAG: hypothetical protein MI747_02430 [Desulfobacterales bacterium]|nr:hypothetical protein [Desulfobacterales bacterium]